MPLESATRPNNRCSSKQTVRRGFHPLSFPLFLCSGVISLEHPVESGYLAPVEPGVREFPQQHAEVASTSLKILPSDRGGFWRLTSTLDVHANVTHVLCKCPYNIYTAVFMHISRVHTRTRRAPAEYSSERANIQRTFENRYFPGSKFNVPFHAARQNANFSQ